jgi:hypothetical protein
VYRSSPLADYDVGLLENIYTNYTPNYAYFILQVKEDDTAELVACMG